MRNLLTAISVAALLAITPALAQTSPTSPPKPTPPSGMPEKSEPMPDKSVPKASPGPSADSPAAKLSPSSMGQNRATYLLNASVKNTSGETVGSINDMLFDETGKISHVIVGVGGFLGIGERNVALKIDQVQIARDSNNRMTALAKISKEQLKTAPEWKDPNAAASERSSSSPGSPPTKPKTQ